MHVGGHSVYLVRMSDSGYTDVLPTVLDTVPQTCRKQYVEPISRVLGGVARLWANESRRMSTPAWPWRTGI
jgi:hypothetical protein